LRELAWRFAERPVQLGEILDATHGRGINLLLVCIALPFLTPMPLPGFSIPFGLVVAIIGARKAFGKKPWLPRKLLARELPPQFLSKLLRAASRVVKVLEYILRPRLASMNEHVVFRRLAGVLITVSGLFLILPLPVPFSNSLGCRLFVMTPAFFLLLAFGGAGRGETPSPPTGG